MPREFDRRRVLSGLTASGSALAVPGIVSADRHSERYAFEISDLDSAQLRRIRIKLRQREDVRSLVQRAKKMGWLPEWRETKGTRKIIETDTVAGRYDTVVVPFTNNREKDSDATMFLTWNGNDTVGLDTDKHPAFQYVTPGAVLTYLEEPIRGVEDIGDLDVREYRTDGDQVLEKSVSDAFSGENYEEAVSGASQSDTGSEKTLAVTSSNEYCEIHVKLFDPDVGLLSCADLECLNINLGVGIYAIMTCLSSGAFVCLGAYMLAGWSVTDCFACDYTDAVVELEVGWLEDNYMALEGDPHPCNAAGPNGYTYLTMTKCELEDAPTKEDYTYAECN